MFEWFDQIILLVCTGMGLMSPGMNTLNQGMANMSLQNTTVPIMPSPMMVPANQRPVMTNMGMYNL